MFVAKLTNSGGTPAFDTPLVTMAGNSNITINSNDINMGVRQIAPVQLGYREVNSMMDP